MFSGKTLENFSMEMLEIIKALRRSTNYIKCNTKQDCIKVTGAVCAENKEK